MIQSIRDQNYDASQSWLGEDDATVLWKKSVIFLFSIYSAILEIPIRSNVNYPMVAAVTEFD